MQEANKQVRRDPWNFFLEAECEGRATTVKTGSKDGGIFVRFYVRNKGKVVEVLHVIGTVIEESEGEDKLEFRIQSFVEMKEYNETIKRFDMAVRTEI